MSEAFSGFKPEALHFLVELALNNDRAWFQPRKAEYERLLRDPLEALCVALGERLAARDLPLQAGARSPFRIHRDTRFSKDKSPYKTHVAASFPWQPPGAPPPPRSRSESVHHVGGYFHLEPDESFVGGGMWHPARPHLDAWRALVDRAPARVHAALDDPGFMAEFESVDGDRLKRVPPGFAADHPDAELLKLRDVVFGRRVTEAEALSPDLPDVLADALARARPVFGLLASLSG